MVESSYCGSDGQCSSADQREADNEAFPLAAKIIHQTKVNNSRARRISSEEQHRTSVASSQAADQETFGGENHAGRTVTRAWAPIFSSFSRIVLQRARVAR
jgi:hypothetical protein